MSFPVPVPSVFCRSRPPNRVPPPLLLQAFRQRATGTKLRDEVSTTWGPWVKCTVMVGKKEIHLPRSATCFVLPGAVQSEFVCILFTFVWYDWLDLDLLTVREKTKRTPKQSSKRKKNTKTQKNNSMQQQLQEQTTVEPTDRPPSVCRSKISCFEAVLYCFLHHFLMIPM